MSVHTFKVPTASGRRRGFLKHVVNVDPSYGDGYAFDGEFIPDGRETDLPIGGIVVRKSPMGSLKNPYDTWDWASVPFPDQSWHWSKQYRSSEFLAFRDDVALALGQEPEPDAMEKWRMGEVRQALRAAGVAASEHQVEIIANQLASYMH